MCGHFRLFIVMSLLPLPRALTMIEREETIFFNVGTIHKVGKENINTSFEAFRNSGADITDAIKEKEETRSVKEITENEQDIPTHNG
mmetsp:Transcript_17192/g.14646  ORF Transcript_17192/g.14646 Transcript_17192/m.14646 type:complete len:87 (+) Transcript_17192:286-546(+)